MYLIIYNILFPLKQLLSQKNLSKNIDIHVFAFIYLICKEVKFAGDICDPFLNFW
jgi:hypothetical protein